VLRTNQMGTYGCMDVWMYGCTNVWRV
jgi:hypothetical protein